MNHLELVFNPSKQSLYVYEDKYKETENIFIFKPINPPLCFFTDKSKEKSENNLQISENNSKEQISVKKKKDNISVKSSKSSLFSKNSSQASRKVTCQLILQNKYNIYYRNKEGLLDARKSNMISIIHEDKKNILFQIYDSYLNKRFLFKQINISNTKAEIDGLFITTENNQDISKMISDYYWKPFEKYLEKYHQNKNIKDYITENFSNIEKDSLVFIEVKINNHMSKIITQGERGLFDHQSLFKGCKEIILLFFIKDIEQNENGYESEFSDLLEIQNFFNAKLMILNINDEFLNRHNIISDKYYEDNYVNFFGARAKKLLLDLNKEVSNLKKENPNNIVNNLKEELIKLMNEKMEDMKNNILDEIKKENYAMMEDMEKNILDKIKKENSAMMEVMEKNILDKIKKENSAMMEVMEKNILDKIKKENSAMMEDMKKENSSNFVSMFEKMNKDKLELLEEIKKLYSKFP